MLQTRSSNVSASIERSQIASLLCATTVLPEQAKPSRSIKRMVLPIRQFCFGLAHRGSYQAALYRVCKPGVEILVFLPDLSAALDRVRESAIPRIRYLVCLAPK